MNKKIIFAFLFLILSTMMVSAYNPFKWQMCKSANVTEGLCDDYWEEFKVLMGVPNKTTTTGMNITEAKALFFNKTTVDRLYMRQEDAEELIKNITKKAIANLSTNNTATKEDLLQLRTDMDSKTINLNNPNYNPSSNSGVDDSTIIIIILIAVVGFGGYIFMNKKNNQQVYQQQFPYANTEAPVINGKPQVRKIQSKRNMTMEEKVAELEEKLERQNKKPSKKGE